MFWKKYKAYLQECTAVHERRHDATYLACAMCQRPNGASKVCPEGTPIPLEQWVRLQFYPQNPRMKTAELYHKRLQCNQAKEQNFIFQIFSFLASKIKTITD